MLPTQVLLPLKHMVLDTVEVGEEHVIVHAHSTQQAAVCPVCHTPSTRPHSWYTRTIADAPCANRVVSLVVRVHRFFCDVAHCRRKIFVERWTPVVLPYARRTTRLTDMLRAVAFAAGGHGGARLATTLRMPTSIRTLLRLMHAHVLPPLSAPRVVGLDDWAWKKGCTYGTLLVDLERHQPIDGLPDRIPDTVAAWLQMYPTIEIIARDRSGGYAEAATMGAPQAIQVADRWHLLKNLGDALDYFFCHHRSVLKQAAHDLATEQDVAFTPQRPAPPLDGTTWNARAEAAGIVWQQAVIDQYHRIHTLRADGVPVKQIAAQLGISPRTVHRYARHATPPDRRRAQVTRSLVLEPFVPYLLQRWNDGCRNASQLWRELRDQYGYRQSLRPVSNFIGALRQESGTRYKFKSVGAEAIYHTVRVRKRPLSVRQASHLFLVPPEHHTAWQEAYSVRLCLLAPAIERAYGLVQRFATMVRQRLGELLDQWLSDVQASGITELQRFADGLRRDYAAVKAGLTQEWSNGQTEAQVHHLKLVKRQMYGKAGFTLLRKRVLYRAHEHAAS